MAAIVRAVAQRRAYIDLRALLRSEIVSAELSTAAQRAVLSAFDRLAFTRSNEASDELVPSRCALARCDDESSVKLILQRGGLPPSAVSGIIGKLTALSDDWERRRDSLRTADHVEAPTIDLAHAQASYAAVRWRNNLFRLKKNRLDWLLRCHTVASAPTPDPLPFAHSLFTLLCRYDALCGDGGGGAGNQGAVPASVYSALEDWAGEPRGAAVEGFASPLNHRLMAVDFRALGPPPWYGSSFLEVDAPFGGGASLFLANGEAAAAFQARLPRRIDSATHRSEEPATDTGGGTNEAPHHRLLLLNPPYGPREMSSMIDSLDALFRTESAWVPPVRTQGCIHPTASKAVRTTALVVVPHTHGHRDPSPHHARLASSPWLVGSAILAPDEHVGFVDGRAHERNAPRTLGRAGRRGATGNSAKGGARQLWAGPLDFTVSLFVLSCDGWTLAERRRRPVLLAGDPTGVLYCRSTLHAPARLGSRLTESDRKLESACHDDARTASGARLLDSVRSAWCASAHVSAGCTGL